MRTFSHLISRIGIGGWQAGGRGPSGAGPAADDEAAIAAIRRAVEGGVNWVDTAASYGLGHSEEVVRRALEPWRIGEEVLVFTKCGHPWNGDEARTDGRAESIRRECEGSLRRLGVERLDMLQLHHPDPRVPIEESWGALVELVDEGKLRWAGLSNVDVDQLDRCERIRHVDAVQPELSLVRPDAARDVVPWCDAHATEVIAYSPQGAGLLTAADPQQRLSGLAEDDPRRERVDDIVALATVVRRLASERGCSPGALAAAWVLSLPGVTGAICGARRPSQVTDWIGAADVVLDAETVALLEDVAVWS